MDAYLIAEAHRAERGVCACGRPLPCIAAQRAEEIMAETTRAAREAEAAEQARRAFSEAITQDLPVLRADPPPPTAAPVGARFPRQRQPGRTGRTGPVQSASGSWPVVKPTAEPVAPPSAGHAFPPPPSPPLPPYPRPGNVERPTPRHGA